MMRKVSVLIVVTGILIQFYRPNRNLQNVNTPNDFLIHEQAPAGIVKLYRNACYDCHSNQTEYKWFDNVAPISWYVDQEVKSANFSLNFSNWKNLNPINKEIMFAAIPYNIESDAMPKRKYKMLHPKAILSNDDKLKMITWLQQVKVKFLKEESQK